MGRNRIFHRINSHKMRSDIYLWNRMKPDLCGMKDLIPCQEMEQNGMGPELCETEDPIPIPWPVYLQSDSTSSVESSSSNSDQNAEKKTYAQALKVLISLQSSNEKISSSSTLQKTEKMSVTSARSQSRTHY